MIYSLQSILQNNNRTVFIKMYLSSETQFSLVLV